MGCCLSNPSPYNHPNPRANSSSRAVINQQPAPPPSNAVPRPPTAASTHSNRPHASHRHGQPLTAHINKPLKKHVWTSKDKIWTREDIDREREVFFGTRTEGRQEIWQAIRIALEILWSGGDAMDQDGGLATTQQILDAAEITVPTGNLATAAFDRFGFKYEMPPYIVSDPTNLKSLEEQRRVVDDDGSKGDDGDKSGDASEEVDEEEIMRRREEKGKGVANPEDEIKIRARRSDGKKDLIVTAGRGDSVRLVVKKLTEEGGLTAGKRIRIAYMGKILEANNTTLADQGWKEGHVVNAMVFGE